MGGSRSPDPCCQITRHQIRRFGKPEFRPSAPLRHCPQGQEFLISSPTPLIDSDIRRRCKSPSATPEPTMSRHSRSFRARVSPGCHVLMPGTFSSYASGGRNRRAPPSKILDADSGEDVGIRFGVGQIEYRIGDKDAFPMGRLILELTCPVIIEIAPGFKSAQRHFVR